MATVKTFTGADGTLFHIAARELGDATEWIRIAQANGISDPMITGTVRLIIPSRSPIKTGGIPQQ
jgi:hypothetical protein